MKVPVSWLSELIELRASPQEVAEILTFGGLEVEEIYDHYETLGEIIAVKIVEVERPSELKDLVLCKITDGKQTFHVLTGAKDKVRPGLIVALAKPGSRTFFWEKIEIKEVKGYTSYGLFLSPYEGGISEVKDELLLLPPETPLGERVYKILDLSEPVLEVAITPNRGDCLSILGLARELSLLTGWPLQELSFEPTFTQGEKPLGKIEVLDPDGCFRYLGRWFTGVEVTESPFAIIKRLILCGLRPINNLVDITNYVLLEVGQPLHAFDWGKIKGGKIVVRSARPGEKLLFLDGVERELTPEDLVIADAEKPLVLAGIMGGEESGVSFQTEEIFLEAAWFNPKRIRLAGMRHRLTTESSYRFERKVDPEGGYLALLRATDLINRYVKSQTMTTIVEEYPVKYIPTQVKLPKRKVFTYLGVEIPEPVVLNVLKNLGSVEIEDDTYKLLLKSYRQDLTLHEDLIEEIARVYGYDKIPTTYPEAGLFAPTPSKKLEFIDQLKRLFTTFGFTEVITYSFIDPKHLELLNLPKHDPRVHPLTITNPISSEMSILRTTLVPGLLGVVQHNQRREVEGLRIFEVGKAFFKAPELADEKTNLAFVLAGNRREDEWFEEEQAFDIFDLKGVIENLALLLRVPLTIRPYSEEPFLKRGLSYDLYLREEKIGFAGRLKSLIAKDLDLREPIFIGELNLDTISSSFRSLTSADLAKPPKFPSTFRDLSLVVKKTLPYETLLTFIKSHNLAHLEKIKLIRLYEGPPISEDERSLTLRLWFRAEDRTLKDEEIEPTITHLVENLIQHLKVKPR